tara:strand:+ start:104 stop:307 length:204 start_codon:yes stop_codon:yes gene_type:complete
MKKAIGIFAIATALASCGSTHSVCPSYGQIIQKDNVKYYQASDNSLHTGQVDDYYAELECCNCDEID